MLSKTGTNKLIQVLLVFVILVSGGCGINNRGFTVKQLSCEYRINPQGLDVTEPRLSWIIETDSREWKQGAYEMLVAGSEKKLLTGKGELWSSGKVNSDQSVNVVYQGRALQSNMQCFWKVRVWDENGRVSRWSKPALWTMGLLTASDWKADWIGWDETTEPNDNQRQLPARMLRHEFQIEKPVRRAVAYVSGLGLFELYLNGQKVGDHVMDPALTDYTKRVFYVTFEVTSLLKHGDNAVAVYLGNGRYFAPRINIPTKTITYGYPKLLLQMHIEYEDGTIFDVLSDRSWKLTTRGPIRANNEYDGEEYDARMEIDSWSQPGFDCNWPNAHIVKEPGGAMVSQMIEPMKVTQTIKAVALTEPKPGVYIFDIGQNIVGWAMLTIKGTPRQVVHMRFAELLRPDGTIYVDNLRSAKATDTYILKGKGTEIYEPRFTYHGFRYVQVEGLTYKPKLSMVQGRVIHSALERTGDFSCSNPQINKLYRNIIWGVRGNLRGIPTDCPQRDERQGWLGDIATESKGEAYDFGVARFYAKWLDDIKAAQDPNGNLPDVAPPYWPVYSANVTWPSAYIIIPAWLYEHYNDRRVLQTNYPAMKKWIEFMSTFLTGCITPRDQYGDWCVPPQIPELIQSVSPNWQSKDAYYAAIDHALSEYSEVVPAERKTSGQLLATAYFYHDLCLMSRYAMILGKKDDAGRFSALAEKIKVAFNDKFLNKDKHLYDNGTMTSSILPLAFRMVPENQSQPVFDSLVENIMVKNQAHMVTGLIGTQWIMRVLSNNCRPDIAYTLATQKTYPSWGYMMGKGATTIWELWNGDTGNPAMNSQNHLMLVGDLGIWLYEYLAGIMPDPNGPGFKKIIIKPTIVGDLTWVQASYKSIHGKITTHWKLEGNVLKLDVVIPANTTAAVYIPTNKPDSVTESGRPAAASKGVKFVRVESNAAVYNVGSGSYSFVSNDAKTIGVNCLN